jgi:GTPase
VRGEVEAYGAGLDEKPEVLALSKADAVSKDELKKKSRALKKAAGVVPLIVSAVTGEGVQEVLHALAGEIQSVRAQEKADALPKVSQGWRP